MFNGDEDELIQISRALAGQRGIDAVHLFSHGDDDSLQLSTTAVNSQALAERAEELNTWRSALSEDPDFLIYGCNLTGSKDG